MHYLSGWRFKVQPTRIKGMSAEIHFQTLPELSLYVHLPWCIRKCPYCDFNSHERRAPIAETAYIDALINDLEQSLPLVWGRPVISVFIGGGTPSLFSPQAIARLLSEIRARLPLVPDAEITMEANPGTFELDRFQGFREAGISRLSLGVQSFSDAMLGQLGRVHSGNQAELALASALKIFDRVNVDLMFGLPGQRLNDLEQELDRLLSFPLTHVSLYQLTLEPNTLFAARPPQGLPDDDCLAEMQTLVAQRLAQSGLMRYEVSAYAAAGQQCQHNLNYWTFGDYLGIGAGAHGKISLANRIFRTVKARNPDAYLSAKGAAAKESEVSVHDLGFEFMLNALRLVEGVPIGRWAQTTGMAIGGHPFLLERLGSAQSKGLMVRRPDRFQATARGLELLNDLQAIFLP
ncbi:MAG: radical SAM family heme chaperone HemW [Burkholderiaceae bacterium]